MSRSRGEVGRLLGDDVGYRAVQAIPGVGPVLVAVVRGRDRRRGSLPGRRQAVLLGGADPSSPGVRHTVRRGPITKQGRRLVRWAAIEAISRQRGGTFLQAGYHGIAVRRNNRNIARVAAARKLLALVFYSLRDGEIRCLADAG